MLSSVRLLHRAAALRSFLSRAHHPGTRRQESLHSSCSGVSGVISELRALGSRVSEFRLL